MMSDKKELKLSQNPQIWAKIRLDKGHGKVWQALKLIQVQYQPVTSVDLLVLVLGTRRHNSSKCTAHPHFSEVAPTLTLTTRSDLPCEGLGHFPV